MFPLGTKLLVVLIFTQTPVGVRFHLADEVHVDLGRASFWIVRT